MQDTLAASASSGHLGAGWEWHDGELTFDRERTRGALGQHAHGDEEEACPAPLRGPTSPDEHEARLALARALWEADRQREAVAVVATADDDAWLSCER